MMDDVSQESTDMEAMPQGFPLEPNDSEGELLSVGDRVHIRSVNSCITELPEEDKVRLLALVGQTRQVMEFDRFGFVWLFFSLADQSADFCLLPREVSRV